jgi:hypothetical protein
MESPNPDPPAREVPEHARLILLDDGLRRARRLAAKALHRASNYALAASMLLAGSGFVICLLYYQPRGVPLHALSYMQFAAAGLLFAVGTALALLVGAHTATKSGWRAIGYALVWAVGVAAFAGSGGGPRASATAAIYFLFVGGIAWSSVGDVYAEFPRQAPSRPARRPWLGPGTGLLVFWLGSSMLFGKLVFPTLPQHLGGGAPRRIELLWTSPVVADEEAALGSSTMRRCMYELHSDATYLYLMTIAPADDGTCWRPRALQMEWLRETQSAVPRDRAFVEVPKSRVRLVSHVPDGGDL